MNRYKYKIEISYIKVDSGEEIPLQTQNIRALYIDRDYIKRAMPIAILDLSVDKNLLDTMILYANENRFNVTLYKFNVDGDQTLEKVFSEQFTYLFNKDVNYNKDLDYDDKETEMNNGKKREDKFINATVGLMCKKTTDKNMHYVNTIANNTSVEEFLIGEFQGMNILIEPFETPNKQTNIVVRPTETFTKLLKKLNHIDGFYATPYRFFMDYDIAYLLSSSGKAVPKKNEKYSSVNIEIRNISKTDVNPYETGIEIDDTNKCYNVPFASTNTEYKMNNVTSKIQNEIKAVVDASKKVKEKANSAKTLINNLKTQANNIKNVVNSNIGKIASIGTDLNTIGRSLEDDIKTATKVNTKIANILNVANSGFGPWKQHVCDIGPFKNIGQALDNILSTNSQINSLSNIISYLPNEFNSMKSELFSTAHKSMNFSSFFDCVKEINFNDNINGAKDLFDTVTNGAISNIANLAKSKYNEAANKYTELSNRIKAIKELIKLFPDQFIVKEDGSDPSPDDPPETIYITVDLGPVKEQLFANLNETDSVTGLTIAQSLDKCATTFSNNIDTMVQSQKTSSNIASGCIGSFNNVANTKNTLKDEFNGGNISLQSAIEVSKDAAAKVSNNYGLKLNKDSSTIAFGGDLLDKLENDISKMGDLNTLGSTGIEELGTKVSISDNTPAKDEPAKIITMRVPNDNVNIVKQEVEKLRLTASVLTINKYDIDTQVFTPNKSYTVKNYDTHSSRDGQFILSEKREIYTREDDVFRLVMVAVLRKVPK